MKTKRFLLSILLLLVMSFNIVPCYATSEGTAEPEFPEFTEEVTITWWNWLSVPEKVVESFNEVYPNITVEFPLVGSGADLYSKWQTVMQSGGRRARCDAGGISVSTPIY